MSIAEQQAAVRSGSVNLYLILSAYLPTAVLRFVPATVHVPTTSPGAGRVCPPHPFAGGSRHPRPHGRAPVQPRSGGGSRGLGTACVLVSRLAPAAYFTAVLTGNAGLTRYDR
jgi:hypothetical protein